MINILSRVCRVREFTNCLKSIEAQTYRDVKVIVAVDNPGIVDTVRHLLQRSKLPFQVVEVERDGIQYHWNLYCNALKAQVTDGWFMFLDDDDELADKDCLKNIHGDLSEEHGIICQFLRKNKIKPPFNRDSFFMEPSDIIRGKIGGSCIILHHSHKNLADWDDQRAADYRFIRDVRATLPLKFVRKVVVRALNNGRHGK